MSKVTAGKILKSVVESFVEITGCPPNKIDRSTVLSEIGVDSLDQLEAVMGVEDDLSVSLDEGEMLEVKTVGEMCDEIAKQLGVEYPAEEEKG